MKWIAFVTGASLLGVAAVGHAGTGATSSSSESMPPSQQQSQDSQQPSQQPWQQSQDAQQPSQPSLQQQGQAFVSHESIVGAQVQNQQGQDLGRIEQLFVDAQDGRIAYAVVARGGLLGMGQDSVQVPWDKISVRRDGQDVVVVMDQEALRAAPRHEGGSTPAASPETTPRDSSDRYNTQGSQQDSTQGSQQEPQQTPSQR
jgi:sporulation protein YlmC with PRC-barrel domain